MDLESVFSPSSYASQTKEPPSVNVHQADVALRLGMIPDLHPHWLITCACMRAGFLRKVYGILTAQLLLSLVICVAIRTLPVVTNLVQTK